MNNRKLLERFCYSVQISKRGRVVIVAANDDEARTKASTFGTVIRVRMIHPTRLHRDRRADTDEALYQSLIGD